MRGKYAQNSELTGRHCEKRDVKGKKPDETTKMARIRSRAEALLQATERDVVAMPTTDVQQLVHELQVRQIELNSQNDELRRTQLELEAARDSYRDLYDFFPAAHLTMDTHGTIVEANLGAMTLLGINRQKLIGQPLAPFFASEDQDIFYRHSQDALKTGTRQTCEMRLRDEAGAISWVHLESLAIHDKPGPITHWRTALLDITERKQAEVLLAAEKKVLELIATGTAMPEVLDTMMRETEAQSTDGMLCSVLLADEKRQRLLHGAAPSLPDAYNTAVHGLVIGPKAGSCGTAAFKHKPVFVDDIAGDPLWNDFKHLAATHGLGACHSTPIVSSRGRLLGTIAMYYRRPHNPGAHDRQLIERATHLAGIAIERRQAEEALRLAKFSVDRAADAVYWIDPQAKVLDVNEAASRMLGYSKDELCAMTVHDLNPDFQTDMWPGFWAETRKRGTMVIETFHKAKNGRMIPIEVSVNFLSYEGKEYHCASVRDITERKRVEAALRKSEERYHSIFENAVDGIFQTTADGKYVAVNPALARIYGYDSPDDMIKTITDIASQLYVDPGRRDVFLSLMQAQEEVTGFESLVYRKDGSFIWISESARTLRDQAGVVVGYEGTVEDITERKRAERQLRATLDQVRTLSGRLSTLQEKERTRIARELHDELGVRLTCLKIDLSRMMSVVGNRVRADLRAKLNDGVRSMVGQVDSTIAAVQRLVTQLRPALLDDLGLVAALEWQSQDFQKRTGISCTCVTSADDIAMEPERATAVFRICQEALTNTARHAQATTVMITVTSQPDALQMTVTDNGVGIPDTKASDPQSLGLLGMQERAAQCGGTLTIEGDPEKGTTVTLCLPIGGGQPAS